MSGIMEKAVLKVSFDPEERYLILPVTGKIWGRRMD